MPGKLFVVATPIGNRGDIGDRARRVLADADLVLAEDTRHTRPLLRDLGIKTPLLALHEHNERAKSAELVDRMRAGADIALVSDAGTPLLSDPGFVLVRAALDAGIVVSPVPGPCAAIAALSVAGIAPDRFAFEGFLPAKPVARRKALESLREEARTLVIYESVHRITAMLDDAASVFGGARRATLARELTKVHESVYTGTLAELATRAADDTDMTRGEVVLVIEGASDGRATGRVDPMVLLRELATELPAGKAATITARVTGADRRALYRHLVDGTE